MTEELVISAGHNPALDSFRSGSISAFRDILNYDFNTQEQGEV